MNRRSILSVLFLMFVLAVGFLAGRASAAQPHMQAALDHLQSAKSELNQAVADKGGHRAKAITLVNKAITEVQAGIDFDRNH